MKKVIFLISILMLVFAGCGRKEVPEPKPEEEGGAAAGPEAGSVTHKVMSFDLEGLTDSGEKKWDVKGESAEAVSENRVKLHNIVASAYGNESMATITADKGVYDKTKNSVRLEENVKATIENPKDKSSSFVDFSDILQAGPQAKTPGLEKSKLTRTVITCDGEVQFDYQKNMAYFIKNVHTVNEEGTIDADKITVYLDPVSKKICQIVAEGNVKIKRGANTTYSQKATYIESEKRILLTGQPKIVIYQEGKLENNLLGK
jgi:lipopolysaccharide export system protein LptA